MKSNLYFLTIIIGIVLLASCKKDDNSNSSTALNNTLQMGKWKITYYIDNGTDQTSHYTGYAFTFNNNGTVNAAKTGSLVNGTWNSGNDDSTLKLVLGFSTSPFDELNDDWHVIQQTSVIIKLEDVSGGNGGIDYLTFEKI